ncbi:MAG: tetratricopeptide repeat protein [Acidobacteriia bacterium]|nr:tetratricopeptide repeat protein [Terriglobia bacterium]
MGRFLRMAVDRTLEGRTSELKEYLLGVEVFDRKPSFDPRIDPIVRVEARRLRSKLQAYYEGDGRNDSIVFEFVAGSYAPRIHRREAEIAEPKLAPAPPAAQQVPTVAVLPFANLSGTADHDYFSDGLTEELIHALTKVNGMRVVAWNSAVRLRGSEPEAPDAKKDERDALWERLLVANVLTGSVRISGCQLRVRSQLIEKETGLYLWSETFDRQMQDVFAIQEEIASNIVRTLRVQLTGGDTVRPRLPLAPRPASLSSYDYYLKGRYHWHRRTPADLARSIQYFQSAIETDPGSALAYAGLADAYTLDVEYGQTHPAIGIPKAKAAAQRAIEIDPHLAEAYCSLALIRGKCEWEWEEAEALYRKSIALNPGYATAHFWLGGDCLAMIGRLDEASAEIETALDLDPLSSIMHECRGLIYLLRREYLEAIRCCREILEFDPSSYRPYAAMGRALSLEGRYKEALEMFEKARAMEEQIPTILAAIGQILAFTGDRDGARGVLAKLEARARERFIPSTCFAVVHLGLGETEQALDWLERGCDEHEMSMCSLGVHPIYDPLRGEPRFQGLLKRLRLDRIRR